MKKEIVEIRERMLRDGIDACIITSSDYHNSEYVNGYFKFREYASGFTGSAGTLVITRTEAGLWTDSRYFIQAELELAGSGIMLYRQRETGVPTIFEFLRERLSDGAAVGLDTRTVTYNYSQKLLNALGERKVRLVHCDYAGVLWTERPELSAKPVYILEEKYSGESAASKLARIREKMREKGAQFHVISGLDDIAWVLNLRGADVAYTPVFYSYLLISGDGAALFAFEEAFSEDIINYLNAVGVKLRPYGAALDEIRAYCEGRRVLVNKAKASAYMIEQLAGAQLVDAPNPSELMKAVKNRTECANIKQANERDGAAMVSFLYYLKKNTGKMQMSEVSVSAYLENCRRRQGALGPSFETIAGYAEHGAIVHYKADEESNRTLEPKGLLLVDSGGHYLEGTTDITRTIALGPLTEEMKRSYTLVLKGMADLAMAVFARGMCGNQLDILAHGPLWQEGLNYKHGTGHGIGYLLSVHEGPQNISYVPGRSTPLEAGMVTSDEPGVYIEGSYGIRIENDLLCVPAGEDMLRFETLTLCPFEREAIMTDLLSEKELAFINDYHKMIYERLAGRLGADEAAWLKEVTAPLGAAAAFTDGI